MRLKAIDQVHISAAKSESLRPGEEFDVSDDLGKELLEKHPGLFVLVAEQKQSEDEMSDQNTPVSAPKEKSAPAPQNKAEAAPANKSEPKRSTK